MDGDLDVDLDVDVFVDVDGDVNLNLVVTCARWQDSGRDDQVQVHVAVNDHEYV